MLFHSRATEVGAHPKLKKGRLEQNHHPPNSQRWERETGSGTHFTLGSRQSFESGGMLF